MGNCSLASKDAQIQVSAKGVYIIPREAGIKLVRDLFDGIGVDSLRANRYFANMSFEDVSELHDPDLTEAIAVGLDYNTDPGRDRSSFNVALLKRLQMQFPHPFGHFVFRVGKSYNMVWPNHRTLTH